MRFDETNTALILDGQILRPDSDNVVRAGWFMAHLDLMDALAAEVAVIGPRGLIPVCDWSRAGFELGFDEQLTRLAPEVCLRVTTVAFYREGQTVVGVAAA